jgi:hypothetical protein
MATILRSQKQMMEVASEQMKIESWLEKEISMHQPRNDDLFTDLQSGQLLHSLAQKLISELEIKSNNTVEFQNLDELPDKPLMGWGSRVYIENFIKLARFIGVDSTSCFTTNDIECATIESPDQIDQKKRVISCLREVKRIVQARRDAAAEKAKMMAENSAQLELRKAAQTKDSNASSKVAIPLPKQRREWWIDLAIGLTTVAIVAIAMRYSKHYYDERH